MTRILYIMHVDWNWIKQRPHFLAEGLSESFAINVWHSRSYLNRKQLVNNDKCINENILINCLSKIPLERYTIIRKINYCINKILLRNSNSRADIIWVTSPMFFPLLRKEKQLIVYDCMDDMLEFDLPQVFKKTIRKNEKCLFEKADIIIATSDHLKKILIDRYGKNKHIYVVNNGIFLNEKLLNITLPDFAQKYFDNKSLLKIVYIGTVAKWFDIELLLSSLEQNDKIEYLIFGPCEISVKAHPRLKILGSVEYRYVCSIMDQADCLVMPFVVNKLIESVNPVKAYEYINACKPVIMPYYDEVAKFRSHCYFYHSSQEYISLISELSLGRLKMLGTSEEHKKFAYQNTWTARIEEIKNILLQYNK